MGPLQNDCLDEALLALSHKDMPNVVAACTHKRQVARGLAEPSSRSILTVSEHLKVLRQSELLPLER
jgi:DNA-binding transcriptional ArsR family regulator